MNTSCNKTSNNKYFDCPARMDDGRAFTDYRQSSTVNDMIRYSNNIMGSNEYRQFLIHNAVNIMNVSNNYTSSKMGCNSCNYEPVPFNTQCDYNNNFPVCNVLNPNGIGIRNKVVGMNSKENFKSTSHNVEPGVSCDYSYSSCQNPGSLVSNGKKIEETFNDSQDGTYEPKPSILDNEPNPTHQPQ